MADQPINGLPKKTAAADTDALLMIGASEEYQIDYGKLADAILNKLTNKTFALDQGSKSLVAALNELNSNIGDIICKKITFDRYSSKFKLKKGIIGEMARYTAIIALAHQDGELNCFGIIGVTQESDKYNKLAGADCTIAREGDNITFTVKSTGEIWSHGILLAPSKCCL